MHKISIVTATYNHSKTLPKLFKSIRHQDHLIYEWLICDDGSDDDTYQMAKSWDRVSYKIKAFRQDHDGMRLAKNINQGFREAKGDLLFLVMGDSYLEDDTMEKLHAVYKDGSAGSGLRKNVNLDGSFHSWDWRYQGDFATRALVGDNAFNKLTGNSMIVPRQALKDIGYWHEGYMGYGRDDWDAFLRLSRHHVPLYQYNTVVIDHVWHDGQPDNPENIKLFVERYENKL